ncbi:hypothetical protein SAMN02910447_01449 [Ruminococcus sp. YE71]|uniref:hypothetical protein n=1 Tax=unclassified Ruminococcus TaxID=2608920 RepID=UPI00088B12ED|nr:MULTISPECIES: hypothetical protein [unclassified Ruminococcus]SDA18876.1 hypothetical protein SAMN02910446_01525 [Ruminococcus sp. YE78]SFW29069.1 hypothetical protein SAMN02910447_01449 [Ruminococcus sp. YE71]
MELELFTAESEEEVSSQTSENDRFDFGTEQTGGLLKGMGIVIVMMVVLLPLLITMDKKTRKHREDLMLIEEMSKKEDSENPADE